jgi:hypothetical protein
MREILVPLGFTGVLLKDGSEHLGSYRHFFPFFRTQELCAIAATLIQSRSVRAFH